MRLTPRPALRREDTIKAAAMFAVVSFLWGIPYLFNEIALRAVGPLWISAIRVAVAATTLGPFLIGGARWRVFVTYWRALLLVAVAEVALPFSLIAVGQQRVPSGTTGVLIATEPIFVAFIALLRGRGRGLAPSGWLGLAVGIAGVAAVLGLHATSASALLIICGAASYAIGATLISRWFGDIDPLSSTAAMLVTAAPMLIVTALIFEPFTDLTVAAGGALLALGIVCSAAGFTAFFVLIKQAGPTRAALTAYTAPIVALLAGAVLLGEQVAVVQVTGCALILLGAGLVMRHQPSAPAIERGEETPARCGAARRGLSRRGQREDAGRMTHRR